MRNNNNKNGYGTECHGIIDRIKTSKHTDLYISGVYCWELKTILQNFSIEADTILMKGPNLRGLQLNNLPSFRMNS